MVEKHFLHIKIGDLDRDITISAALFGFSTLMLNFLKEGCKDLDFIKHDPKVPDVIRELFAMLCLAGFTPENVFTYVNMYAKVKNIPINIDVRDLNEIFRSNN